MSLAWLLVRMAAVRLRMWWVDRQIRKGRDRA